MSSSTTSNPALAGIEATLGSDMMRQIQNSKILLVGAGGIGCELLKNLALSGFQYIEVIDLDTIDVSNLNRQFLFRSQHVGMPKCEVACEVAQHMAPSNTPVSYTAHHGNVCDNSKFNVQYVSSFNLVLNALDNVVARRRVNRLCLAANVPLVEAGTTGYLGQVKVIHRESSVACYECSTQETQKVYPICTIRSTPSMPVHTIVWSKELYKLLFGDKVEDSMLYEDTTSSSASSSEPPSTYMASVLQYRDLLLKNHHDNDASLEDRYKTIRDIITHLYVTEIDKQLEIGRYKTAKKTPTPLKADDIAAGTAQQGVVPPMKTKSTTETWSIVECIAEFTACLVEADNKSKVLQEFDKDDELAMRLVTAASNLRSYVFGIEPIQSYYSAKGIAGNIIPAIATTNAIVAGFQVLQVFHILKAQLEACKTDDAKKYTLADKCRYMDVTRAKMGRSGYYISSTSLNPPNPKCFVCRNATIPLTLNVQKWTLEKLLEKIIKSRLGFEEPTVLVEGDIIYEEGEGAETEAYVGNLSKLLVDLPCGGIQHGTVFRVEDFSQDLEVDVCVHHKEHWEPADGEDVVDDAEQYEVGGEKLEVKKPAPVAMLKDNGEEKKDDGAGMEQDAEEDDDDSVIEVVDDPAHADKKRPAEESGTPPAKKAKNGDDGAAEVIVID